MNITKTLVSIILFSISLTSHAGGPVLPEKWRFPTPSEGHKEYNNSQINTLISGDFNSDGLVDGALIVITTDNKSQDLVVFIYDKKLKEQWQVLDSLKFTGKISMGIRKYKPGKYKVLCETEKECQAGYKKVITIKNDAISYYRPESANSIFIFENNEFNRIWQSD